MSSGTPVIAYYLDGMPREYTKYFYNVPETDDGLYKTIEKVISLSENERDSFGKMAQEFVYNKKNPKCQCKKILDMIKECKSE